MSKTLKPVRATHFFATIRRETPAIVEKENELGSKLILARNVLRMRVQRGWTQKELAEHAGISQPRIAEIESARSNPRVDTLDKIARALNVQVSSLFHHREHGSRTTVKTSVAVSAGAASRSWNDDESIASIVDITRHFAATPERSEAVFQNVGSNA